MRNFSETTITVVIVAFVVTQFELVTIGVAVRNVIRTRGLYDTIHFL